jgi:hypothetical protein
MDADLMYRYLIDSTWFFLGSWVLLLLGACVMAFRPDSSRSQTRSSLNKPVH